MWKSITKEELEKLININEWMELKTVTKEADGEHAKWYDEKYMVVASCYDGMIYLINEKNRSKGSFICIRHFKFISMQEFKKCKECFKLGGDCLCIHSTIEDRLRIRKKVERKLKLERICNTSV